jgi:hypothetical protein
MTAMNVKEMASILSYQREINSPSKLQEARRIDADLKLPKAHLTTTRKDGGYNDNIVEHHWIWFQVGLMHSHTKEVPVGYWIAVS